MDNEREAQHHRLTEPNRSRATKLAWKRHHNSYMQGNRKKERNNMNKTFYSISKEIEEALNEAKIQKDDIFDLKGEITFDNLSGGFSFSINKDDGNISFSTMLTEDGHGNYRLENTPSNEDFYKELYEDLRDDLQELAKTVDDSMRQILARHGLREA